MAFWRSPVGAKPKSVSEKRCLFSSECNFLYENLTRREPVAKFSEHTVEMHSLTDPKTKLPVFQLLILDQMGELLTQELGDGIQLQVFSHESVATWYAIVDGKVARVGVEFYDLTSTETAARLLHEFVSVFNLCVYYDALQEHVPLNSNGEDPFNADEMQENIMYGANALLVPEEEYDEPVFQMDISDVSSVATGGGNICFADSITTSRAVLLQKAKGGVNVATYAYDEDGFKRGRSYARPIPELESCSMALLDHTGRNMLVLGEAEPENALSLLDIERGSVVQEYRPVAAMECFTYSQKVPEGDPNVYTCATRNAMFNIDVRLKPKNCIVMEHGKGVSDYAYTSFKSTQRLTCVATSANKHVVVGDSLGNVRLYTGAPASPKADGKGRHPKTAKTLIQLGKPILHLDVNYDGTMVLATLESCAVVLSTEFVDDSGTTKNGFETRMGKKKPNPVVLTPRPEDVVAMGGTSRVRFSKATFERSTTTDEHWVSAGCGDFICTWSIESIKASMASNRPVTSFTYNTQQKVEGITIDASANHTKKLLYMSRDTLAMRQYDDERQTRSDDPLRKYFSK